MPTCPDMLAELRGERDRIDRAIRDLTTSRGLLDGVIAAAGDQHGGDQHGGPRAGPGADPASASAHRD